MRMTSGSDAEVTAFMCLTIVSRPTTELASAPSPGTKSCPAQRSGPQANTRLRYSMLFVAMTSGPSVKSNTSTDT